MSDSENLEAKVKRLKLVQRVGIALTAERNKDRLLEMILVEAKQLCRADGGTLYVRTDDACLRYAIMVNDTLKVALGGTTGKPITLPPIPLHDPHSGEPNEKNVASATVLRKQSFNIIDAYETQGFDFSGAKAFDADNDYRSKSFLTIPMVNHEGRVMGVLQLINAKAGEFSPADQEIVEALASQAAVTLDNQVLLEQQKQLLESFIKLIAAAIDSKSPYTGAHCERVPILTQMLAKAACEDSERYRDFSLTDEEWYELRIAAWLHDCGKVTTPVHVMDKATKLETIHDRIAGVRARVEVMKRDLEIGLLKDGDQEVYDKEIAALDDDMAFLEMANIGGEFLSDDKKARIREIAKRELVMGGQTVPLLDDDEIDNLAISRGTLTNDERLIINGHMVQTIKMLKALPFPPNLERVPEYAGGHHEKMDGSGYPKGIFAGDMSLPARMMAIADVFEALTAQDRPYKKGKTLSESMRIMGFMKQDNHLDPELFDLFVRSGVWREYGERFLPAALIDEVDTEALLAIEPKPYELPDESFRQARWQGFLDEYEGL